MPDSELNASSTTTCALRDRVQLIVVNVLHMTEVSTHTHDSFGGWPVGLHALRDEARFVNLEFWHSAWNMNAGIVFGAGTSIVAGEVPVWRQSVTVDDGRFLFRALSHL